MAEIGSVENNAQDSQVVRENIVQTAVKFLQNTNVVNTPLAQKQKFLQRKGLSDKEIQIACERAGAYLLHEKQNREVPAIPAPIYHPLQSQIQPFDYFNKFKEFVHSVAIFSGVAYAIYMFYKKFIRPFLFGEKKKKTIEEQINELNQSVSTSIIELRDTLTDVKIEVDRMGQIGDSTTQRQLNELKSEISTVKGLLLSRKQFPSVSNNSVVPPSIPAWQLSSVQPDPDPDTIDAKSDDLMEIGSGSGSGSSEHGEQGTKTSDSSLEIM